MFHFKMSSKIRTIERTTVVVTFVKKDILLPAGIDFDSILTFEEGN